MTLSLLVVSALVGVPNLEKHTALACSCVELKEPTEALKESTAVFVGRVVEIEESQANQFSYGAIFEIQRAWKGIESDMPVVRVSTGTSECGYGFQENKEYLVYAYGDPKELATSICSRTMTLDNAQPDLTALGPSAVSFDDQGSKVEKYMFSIWPVQSEISENWQTDIRTRICPNPEVNSIVGPAGSGLSTVNVTHFATNSDGVATAIRTEYLGGDNDFCDGNAGFGYEPDGHGDWTLRANATWTAQNGAIHQVQGYEAKLLVRPALYKTNSEVLFEYDTDYYKSLRLLDWNPAGGAILLAYYSGYQNNITSDIETTGGYETQVSLGVLDPNEKTINRVALPVNFTYIFDARYSPSDSNIIFITGSIGDLVLQSGLFIYSFEHGTLSRVGPYTGDLAWIRDVTGDGQDDFVVGITNSTFEDGEITANTVEVWITDSNANPIEKLYSDTLDSKRGLQVHDVTNDGKKILMTSSLYLGGPITAYNLTVFDVENRRFETTIPFGSGDGARFSPAGDLIVYPVGLGHRTPGGPLIVTTLDGSYVERLSSGEQPGTYDSPDTFVISPDGTTIIAGVAQWGYGNIYVTKNELVHPMPDFGPLYSVALAAGILVTFVFLWRQSQCVPCQ